MSNKKINSSNQRRNKISKQKSDLSVNVIRYNQFIDKLKKQMADTLLFCEQNSKNFNNQRELNARTKMMQRVINSALKMLDGNRLQLWMIDDRAIEQKIDE